MRGSLLIVGGAVRASADEILARFIAGAGGSGARFAVLPAATVNPDRSFASFEEQLGRLGVDGDSVSLLRVSLRKPGWEKGAWDPAQVGLAALSDGIWILGGDQNAIVDALVDADGTESPLLVTLRDRLAHGAIIGGTSAGAAVMSDPMIAGGTSFGALSAPLASGPGYTEISDNLYLRRGLGFFPAGITDQHFDSRARLGRLLVACLSGHHPSGTGYGLAEDTAVVWDAASGTLDVLGAGGLYVIDTSTASMDLVGDQRRIRGALLHYILAGERFDTVRGTIDRVDSKSLDPASPSFAVPFPDASGVMSGYGQLVDFVGTMLMDNHADGLHADDASGTVYVRSWLTGILGSAGTTAAPARDGFRAWEVRLGRYAGQTTAWASARGTGHIGFSSVRVDILPVLMDIRYRL
ncbi:MAG: cyanophycinase [Spirochaetales bacterium]|nr:cyanophycinase [Spirochaetales bacterium]